MMAKKPADRYQTMDEVAHVLRRWLADRGLGPDGSGLGSGTGGSGSSSGKQSFQRQPQRRTCHRPAVDAGRLVVQTPRLVRFDGGRLAQGRRRSAYGGARRPWVQGARRFTDGLGQRSCDRVNPVDRPPQSGHRGPFRSQPAGEAAAQGDAAGRSRRKGMRPRASRRAESPISLDDVLCSDASAVDNRQTGNNRQAVSPRQTGPFANGPGAACPNASRSTFPRNGSGSASGPRCLWARSC